MRRLTAEPPESGDNISTLRVRGVRGACVALAGERCRGHANTAAARRAPGGGAGRGRALAGRGSRGGRCTYLANVVIKTMNNGTGETTRTADTHHADSHAPMGCVMDKNAKWWTCSSLVSRIDWSCTARADDARRTAANTRKTARQKTRGKRRRTAASTRCMTRCRHGHGHGQEHGTPPRRSRQARTWRHV